MSGSNALAAAKRRRGGTDNRGPLPPGSKSGQNSSQPSIPGQNGQVNPLQLLAINHQRLNKLSDELPKTIDALGESFNALSSNCDYLHENFNILQKEVSALKLLNQSKSQPDISKSVDSDKFNRLETDIVELNKVVSRMQSFSMDTNIQLVKLKENHSLFETSINKRFDNLEKIYSNIIERLNGFDNQVLEMHKTINNNVVPSNDILTSSELDVTEVDRDN